MPHFQYPCMAAVARGQHPQQLHHMPSPQQPLMIPQQNHQQQQGGYQQRNQSGPRNTSEKKVVHFDPVPLPYDQIFPYLVQKGMVELKPLRPLAPHTHLSLTKMLNVTITLGHQGITLKTAGPLSIRFKSSST
ncbi:hypothetical protein A2U01_0053462, partial [Trifolium medium]|nr:hypothetical protein [Trifolium medium]